MYKKIITSSDNKKILQLIGNELLALNLSPCIHISDKTESVYRWQNKIQNSTEYILTVKTIKKNTFKCCNIINEYHNYKIPEIVEVDFNILNDNYKDWFNENL